MCTLPTDRLEQHVQVYTWRAPTEKQYCPCSISSKKRSAKVVENDSDDQGSSDAEAAEAEEDAGSDYDADEASSEAGSEEDASDDDFSEEEDSPVKKKGRKQVCQQEQKPCFLLAEGKLNAGG